MKGTRIDFFENTEIKKASENYYPKVKNFL
jgi:hypothetical protein